MNRPAGGDTAGIERADAARRRPGLQRLTGVAAATALAAAALPPAAFAQALPANVAPRIDPGLINQQDRRNQIQLEEQTNPLSQGPAVVAPKAAPNPIAPRGGPTFVLRAVTFDPSTFLTRAELDAVAAPYLGKRVDISDVQRIVKAVNDLLTDRKIATAAAFLPQQDLRTGTLRVGIVEGKLGQVTVKNNVSLDADYLRSRIGGTPGQVVDPNALGDDVARFNKTGVAQVQAFLQPGTQFGLSDIQLSVTEPPVNAMQLFVDNQGVGSVGTLEGGFLFQRYGFFGLDDRFTLYTVKSSGNFAGNASYNVPFDLSGGRIGLSGSAGRIHIVNGPFVPLDVDGSSQTAALNLSQPLYVDQNWLVLALASFGYTKSSSDQSRIPITDNQTFKGTGGATIGYSNPTFAASVSPTFTYAHTDFGVTDQRTDFNLYSGTYGASLHLPYDFLAVLGGSFQVSSKALIPGDSLFQIGGPTTVRGFPTDAIAGPTGYYGNLELHHGLASLSSVLSGIDVYGFYDRGSVYNVQEPRVVTLNSAGVGLSYDIKKVALAELGAGFPLNHALDRQPDYEFYFRLTAKLQ